MIKTYRHSGALGDIIMGLSLFNKIENGHLIINLEYCEKKSLMRFGYGDTKGFHAKTVTQQSYDMLLPLLKEQAYITSVSSWREGDPEPGPHIDLDDFKINFARNPPYNYVESYFNTFNVPFAESDYHATWLNCHPQRVASIVVSRSARYHGANGDAKHKELAEQFYLKDNGIFIGTEEEHADYVRVTGCSITHYKIKDYLEMTNVIAGADLFISNQTFAYTLALGVGQRIILETFIHRPLHQNECYFPRANCTYF